MKSLILITNHFPHGTAEAFIQYELPFLRKHFTKVIIVSRDVISSTHRAVDYPNYRINPISSLSETFSVSALMLIRIPEVLSIFWTELYLLLKQKRKITSAILKKMFHDLFKAYCTTLAIERILVKEKLTKEVVVYSYWLTPSALGATLLRVSKNVNLTRVARGHGGDVFEFRHSPAYLSYRSILFKRLDFIFPISENAKQHILKSTMKPVESKIIVHRLGTPAPSSVPAAKNQSVFTIVSCAFLSPNKRVDLLLEALLKIQNKSIHWIHLGGGILLDSFQEKWYQLQKEHSHLAVTWKGSLSVAEIEDFYSSTYVDLFVNTSLQEGIPVSMMEALSYGIPILATNVGAVSEIIDNSVGQLIEIEDANPFGIAKHILTLLELGEAEKQLLRKRCRERWNKEYNDVKNFSTFASILAEPHHETT